VNGIDVLYELHALASFQNAQLARVIANDTDLYILDHSASRVFHYTLDDVLAKASPANGDATILKSGDKVGDAVLGKIRDRRWVESTTAPGKAGLVAVTNNALLQYNLSDSTWRATVLTDANKWGDIRAADSFAGNVYLLDAGKNQIWKYAPTADG